MKLTSFDYFHGAPVDDIRGIISSGHLRPNRFNEIFLSRFNWEESLSHGADTEYGASFVIGVRISVPTSIPLIFTETHGVRGTAIIRTEKPIPAVVTALYVRRMARGSAATLERYFGVETIQEYLRGLSKSGKQ